MQTVVFVIGFIACLVGAFLMLPWITELTTVGPHEKTALQRQSVQVGIGLALVGIVVGIIAFFAF